MQEKADLLSRCRHFILDLDGTFYLGDTILPHSLEFLRKVEETGRDYLFFTNNSSKSPEVYLDKLGRMGCRISKDQIMTSGDVMIAWLNEHHLGEPVYLVGTPALEESFRQGGIPLSQNANIVVIGFDTTLTYAKLVRACDLIRGGALFLATHLDINCPVEGGFIPDVGSFCALISLSTGGKEPLVTGKPHRETVDMIIRRTGWKREEIAFVGDRIYTDVATGVDNGAVGLLVLSGESDMGTVAASKTKPDGIFTDLGEIGSYLK
ncbi:MAG: HAD-IIA family hydrolase [Sphaerochaeta sp.]|jgi:HAD superfamily hydrolase (TIGR01450 family)|nr:HAD-IIA family hydrolase [Sphaerochaeta sp.]